AAEPTLAPLLHHLPRPSDDQPAFGAALRGPDMDHDPPAAIDVLSDLHGRRPRRRAHPPNPRHRITVGHQLVPQNHAPSDHHRRSTTRAVPTVEPVTKLRSEPAAFAGELDGLGPRLGTGLSDRGRQVIADSPSA